MTSHSMQYLWSCTWTLLQLRRLCCALRGDTVCVGTAPFSVARTLTRFAHMHKSRCKTSERHGVVLSREDEAQPSYSGLMSERYFASAPSVKCCG